MLVCQVGVGVQFIPHCVDTADFYRVPFAVNGRQPFQQPGVQFGEKKGFVILLRTVGKVLLFIVLLMSDFSRHDPSFKQRNIPRCH